MKKTIFLLLSFVLFFHGYAFAAPHDIHIEWTYDYQPVEGQTLAGYNLYKAGIQVCTTNTSEEREMDCTFDSEDGLFTFTLTSYHSDGSESPHSTPYTFALSSPTAPELKADFTTNLSEITTNIPFTVSFDANNSTGNISSYSWDFGDSSTSGSSTQTSHTYTTADTHTAILTVTSDLGVTDQKSVSIQANTPPVPASTHSLRLEWTYDQPVEGKTLAGYYLYKDGTKICTTNSPENRAMDCTFDSADGTFAFTLTAFCSDGTESPHSPPYTFILTTQSEPDLIADFTTNPITLTGDVPFPVSFNSQNSSGNIATYSWDFGDNNSSTSTNPTHTYTTTGTRNATLTIRNSSGATSQKSVTVTATAPPTPPVATITPGQFSGDAPLRVSFDGSTSTSAVSYAWSFGDGATATASQPVHTFTTSGSYTTTLTVTNSLGQTHSSSTTITVNETVIESPPTAIIASSTAMGDAPFDMSFNGSSSHDYNNEPVSSYLWNFGDGSQTSTQAIATHRYTEEGTFYPSLTVTDSQGTTNTTSTPVIITEQTVENQAPTAHLTASVTSGSTPLVVEFEGSTSTDPEGAPLTYNWNFGDGTSEQVVSPTHTYTTAGSFTATLTVTDDSGATSSTNTIINAEEGIPEFQIELGEIELDHNWIRIDFSAQFTTPVVVAGSPSRNGGDPCVIRLRNITSTGFDIRIQEWTYLDGAHTKETVAYLVMEQGNFTLDDGTLIEARQFTSNDTNFQTVQFNTAFTVTPVVMSSIATFNEEDTVTGRLRNISTTSFDHKTQEQQLANGHGNESINYIAWEPTRTTIDNITVIVNKTADKVRNRWYSVNFGEQLTDLPIFLGTMQSQDGRDPSAIRYSNKTDNGIQVMVEEERSADNETRHTSETVGYFLFSNKVPPVPAQQFAINFQPENADVPIGFTSDSGQAFTEIADFGWTILPNSVGTRDRNNPLSEDQSYDTFIHIAPEAIWEHVLPNGTYNVSITIGDATAPDSTHSIQVENIMFIDSEPLNSTNSWFTKDSVVTVNDGKLTLSFLGSAPYAKICRIIITTR